MDAQALDTISDRHAGRRVLAFALAGILGAGVLTWFMYTLILTGDRTLDESGRAHMIDFVRIKREEASVRKDRRPERPDLQDQPPAPATPDLDSNSSGDTLNVSDTALPQGLDGGMDIGGLGFGSSEGDYLPIVKIAPIYPQRALQRGLEGNCTVEYTVTTTGATRDVRVLEDRCDSSLWHGPSIDAAKKFKYKPRVIDGEAVEVFGVTNRFIYVIPEKK